MLNNLLNLFLTREVKNIIVFGLNKSLKFLQTMFHADKVVKTFRFKVIEIFLIMIIEI
jgi:hypothetical protein